MIETKQSTYSSDLWALGVIIYQMLSGKIPFKGKTQENTFEKIKSGVFEMDQSIPQIAQDLIKKLLVKRLGSVFLNELMTHEFFEGIDFENIST
jgi:3-phosphoinositide dependent protein kinase-1